MKLSVWAKTQGISYRTAWRWFANGTLPVEAEQTSTGTILVKEGKVSGGKVAIYARVSSSDQKKDLESQICRLALFASTQLNKFLLLILIQSPGVKRSEKRTYNYIRTLF